MNTKDNIIAELRARIVELENLPAYKQCSKEFLQLRDSDISIYETRRKFGTIDPGYEIVCKDCKQNYGMHSSHRCRPPEGI